MAEGKLFIRVVDGGRAPFGGEILITLFNGREERVHREFYSTAFIQFTIQLTNGPDDVFRVIASSDNHWDSGQVGVQIKEGIVCVLDLMLLPQNGAFLFEPLSALADVHPNLLPRVQNFLSAMQLTSDQQGYERLQRNPENALGLGTLLSIASSFQGFGPVAAPLSGLAKPISAVSHPLDFLIRIERLQSDRFFAEVDSDMVRWLAGDHTTFQEAGHGFHKGAFISYKEQRYSEGNVQFTFAKIANSSNLQLDCDIDFFKDQVSHFFIEILTTDIIPIQGPTDPRKAYAFRWMAVQRMKVKTGLDFKPPFAVVPA